MENILDANEVQEFNKRYAGFWIRVVAYIIDAIVFSGMQVVLSFIMLGRLWMNGADALQGSDVGSVIIYYLLNLTIGILYFVGMECSQTQGTLGKMAMGIKVGKLDGSRISFLNSLGRYLAKIISGIILMIGFMMVGWDAKKQGLHDKMADTIVYYK